MKKGTVKFFNETKGFGFIIPEDGGKEIFFHHTGFGKAGMSVDRDDEVFYNETETDRGPAAVNIVPA